MSQPSWTVRKAETPCGAAAAASGRWSNFELGRELGLDHRAGGTARPRHHLRQPVVGLRPEHDVHPRRARGDLGTLRLGDAARHGQHHAPARRLLLALEGAQAPELREQLLRSLLADVAGVEDDHVGRAWRLRRPVAQRRQHLGHASAVVDVHLAAPAPDEQPLAGRSCQHFAHGRKPDPIAPGRKAAPRSARQMRGEEPRVKRPGTPEAV